MHASVHGRRKTVRNTALCSETGFIPLAFKVERERGRKRGLGEGSAQALEQVANDVIRYGSSIIIPLPNLEHWSMMRGEITAGCLCYIMPF